MELAKACRQKQNTDFYANLDRELSHLADSLAAGQLDQQQQKFGAELEAWIVDDNYQATPKSEWMLSRLQDSAFVPELSQFHIEYNAPVYSGPQFSLRNFASDLQAMQQRVQQAAASMGAKVLWIGSLANLSCQSLSRRNMTRKDRYRRINQRLQEKNRFRSQVYRIEGEEVWEHRSRSIMPVSAMCSLQMHYQPKIEDLLAVYNACLYVAAPMVAVSANTAFLFGHRLWDESRIPLFEQSIASNTYPIARAGLGSGYLRQSPMEYFRFNRDHYDPLLVEPLRFEEGRFTHNSLHTSTIWHWNRLIVGAGDHGQDYAIRVEFRPVSAGPSLIDMTSHYGFFLGLVKNLSQEIWTERVNFSSLQENLSAAARHSLQAEMWALNGRRYAAHEYIAGELIPRAAQGLADLGVSSEDIQFYLTENLLPRCRRKANGASWQKEFIDRNGRDFSRMLANYWYWQESGLAVKDWASYAVV